VYRGIKIAALVPAYNEEKNVGKVITTMPDFVDFIIICNDGSTDATAQVIASSLTDRCIFIDRSENKGLGATLIETNQVALSQTDTDIFVIMAGDAQMSPQYLPSLLDPLVEDQCDFSKGNRFYNSKSYKGMPKSRIFGNIILTFLTKIATGYWSIFDPQNGYTAIKRSVAQQIDWDRIAQDYSYENDILLQLANLRARVKDVNIPALYADETSTISLSKTIPSLLSVLWRGFWRRAWLEYVIRSLSVVIIFLVLGTLLTAFGLGYGGYELFKIWGVAPLSAAKAVLIAVTLIMGLQFLLGVIILDIMNEPK